MPTKQQVIDRISIEEDGVLLVRRALRVFDDDGTKIGERFHRATYTPGQDVTNEPPRIRQLANFLWTPAVIAAYAAAHPATPPTP